MKWTLQVVLFLALAGNVQAQVHAKQSADAAVSPVAINVASEKIRKNYIAPQVRMKSANAAGAEIEVTYVGFPDEARQAFEYAVSIWEGYITSSVPIRIQANWEEIDGNVLGLGRPSAFYVNFEGRPHSHVYYPVALAEKLAGKDLNNGQPDIVCSFNSRYPWYFGVDGNTPVSKYDFVSSVLHEITHGLGFSGFLSDENGTGFFDNSNNLPSIYDYYIFNSSNQQLSDKSLFNSPSADLHKQLVSGELKIYEPESTSEKGWIYSPSTWNEGVSIYHLEDSDDSFMGPYAHKGQAVHQPEKSTLEILSGIGWKAVTFDFDEVVDFEQPCQELPVDIAVVSDFDIDSSSVKLFFSTDYLSSVDSLNLSYNGSTKKFEGNIPLQSKQGIVQYYFKVNTSDNRTFGFPAQAPDKLLSFRVGTDYSAPEITHNPVKIIHSGSPVMDIKAQVLDNIGINSVKVEYRLNGTLMEPADLSEVSPNTFAGAIRFTGSEPVHSLEYRIVAVDKSAKGNRKIYPQNGFLQVEIFNPLNPVEAYTNDFETATTDFVSAGFTISGAQGFSGQILHSLSPYTNSMFENEKVHMTAQLAYPVVIKKDGIMSFSEVVLVEPGEANTSYSDELFWDYVIVEASKDNGQTWIPLTEGYDSGADDEWHARFTSSIVNNFSTATGSDELFRKRTINLTGDSNLEAGDTVIFRFRLTADQSLNGWGWAIDNLEIQKTQARQQDDSMWAGSDVSTFPNPFQDSFFIDCSKAAKPENINVVVTDLFGKTIYRSNRIDASFDPRVEVNLSDSTSGIYLVTVTDGESVITSNKMIKN